MDKQPSDHIENQFRQAAENFLPPQNEEAWEKMNALLDKDKSKKRPVIWFWFLAFLGCLLLGGAFMCHYFNSNSGSKVPVVNGSTRIAEKGAASISRNRKTPVKTSAPGKKNGVDTKAELRYHPLFSTGTVTENTLLPAHPGSINKIRTIRQSGRKRSRYIQLRTHVYRYQRDKPHSPAYAPAKKMLSDHVAADDFTEDPLTDDNLPSLNRYYLSEVEGPASALKSRESHLLLTDSLQQSSGTLQAVKKKESKLRKFYLIASIGKDAISLHHFDTKDVGLVYGGELGYQVNSFLSIQAGFHAGRKKYVAGASDYKFNPDSVYWRMVTIHSIDANCLIFDVPVSARFDVLWYRHTSLYATAGFSSFIMKSEHYVYHYTSSSGYHKPERNYKGNIDLFSSANFSVGLEQKISKTLYIQAEPYMKMPLSGIGEGKIMLYSLGMQIGLKYQPLKR